jgi:hypothetical protein
MVDLHFRLQRIALTIELSRTLYLNKPAPAVAFHLRPGQAPVLVLHETQEQSAPPSLNGLFKHLLGFKSAECSVSAADIAKLFRVGKVECAREWVLRSGEACSWACEFRGSCWSETRLWHGWHLRPRPGAWSLPDPAAG